MSTILEEFKDFFVVKPYELISARTKKPEEEAEASDEERRHRELLAALERLATR